jgi:multiple sugar transport system permease protein
MRHRAPEPSMQEQSLAPSPPRRRRQHRPFRRAEVLSAWGFLLPNLLGFILFTALPVAGAVGLSFCRWRAIESWEGIHWEGLANYSQILGFHHDAETARVVANDGQFWYYMYNTAYLMAGIPVGMILSFITALLLNEKLRGVVVFRTIYFIPTICSSAAVAVLWRWMLNADDGLLNAGLHLVGISNAPDWLSDPAWAKPALIIIGLWVGVGGYNCILYLAGLQNVPGELYEAADMDGAGWWAKLRHITWPMLAPTTFFILVTSIIAGFQGHFTHIHILTRGGPADSTTTLLYYIYQHAFVWHNMGYACALSVILFLVVMVVTLINWKHGGRAVEIQ